MEVPGIMTKMIISKFKELPKTKSPWWALILVACAVSVNILHGFMVSVIRPLFDGVNLMVNGIFFVVAAMILSVVSLIIDSLALKKGERSWVLWVGFVPAILLCLLWVCFLGAEIFFMA